MINKRLAILASGSGTNLQAIIDALHDGSLPNTEISIVISNKKDAYALQRAQEAKIENLFLNPNDYDNSEEYDKALINKLKKYNIDLIVLAGYTRILTETFINAFPENRIINIHPALLPKYGGKGMYGDKVHQAVLENREKESGCTIHYVIPEVDAGPIITQAKVSVLENDTVETLSKRIRNEEHKLFVKAIHKVLLQPVAQKNN